jgi:DNA invertase Pin-like site-specific DNA recombinase
MAADVRKVLRCAIYTRKSTEHGLEQEFNSLDAQREACEAYTRSQASQGWKALPQHYDDPAYSGGNLNRPALKELLADIEAGKIDVVVVYKIDRLTRSLADFAKLVEAFDARSISFVAVTQQFNTTTSMGRLTLNVLLSFAQFERELSSERVRDKIAASRRKGKWTGGTVPLGYDAQGKKLVINKAEAETVRTIFRLYLELKSSSKLVAELDRRKIVTKRRDTKVAKYQGGIPFTYGPLVYSLKNRIYLGEVHHGGKWFKGEHAEILDKPTFERVQDLLKCNSCGRRGKSSKSGALLQGKLYDDKGNLMGPSFSSKNGVRYRFYVSRALLRGRKAGAGSVARVASASIEKLVVEALRSQISMNPHLDDTTLLERHLSKVELGAKRVVLNYHADAKQPNGEDADRPAARQIQLPWTQIVATSSSSKTEMADSSDQPDPKALQAIARAHCWVTALEDGKYSSVEELALSARLHPKVLRGEIRFAFLSPVILESILNGDRGLTLRNLRKVGALHWRAQHAELYGG